MLQRIESSALVRSKFSRSGLYARGPANHIRQKNEVRKLQELYDELASACFGACTSYSGAVEIPAPPPKLRNTSDCLAWQYLCPGHGVLEQHTAPNNKGFTTFDAADDVSRTVVVMSAELRADRRSRKAHRTRNKTPSRAGTCSVRNEACCGTTFQRDRRWMGVSHVSLWHYSAKHLCASFDE